MDTMKVWQVFLSSNAPNAAFRMLVYNIVFTEMQRVGLEKQH